MQYRISEKSYGPEIRFTDWRVTRGDLATDHVFRETRGVWRPGGEGVNGLFSAGGAMQIYATETAVVTRQDYIYGGGGDVELRVGFEIERLGPAGSSSFRFNDRRVESNGEEGFAVTITPGRATFFYRNGTIAAADLDTAIGVRHDLVIATLAEDYLFRLNGEVIASGSIERHSQDNEGWTHFKVTDAGIRILAFEENFIVHDVKFSDWEKKELLYEEKFGPKSWEANWVLNGEKPEVCDDFFVFGPISNVILNRRFDGPIVAEIEATPVATDDLSGGVTDAIFIWMMDHPKGDLAEYIRNLPDANRQHHMDSPFYWMDFGGTNNVTTRQRRSPNLRMVRQFVDADRLLQRDTTYQISLVQNGNTFEFWVDGKRWIQAHDPEPLTSGFIGHRSFNSNLKISGLKIWKIEE